MNFDRDYRFFLKVAFACLVASMLLPFGFDSSFTLTHISWVPGYSGPTISPEYRIWDFYWSFMYIREVEVVPSPLPPSMLLPVDQDFVGLSVGFFPEYWGWRPRPRSILYLQVSLIIFGFITIRKAKSARSIIPFYLGILSLSFIHLSTVSLDISILSFGISILSTIFATLAIGRAP